MRSGWLVNLLLALLVIGLALVVVLVYENRFNPFPKCTSARAAAEFKRTFDGSPFARTLNLTAIDVVAQRTISDDTARSRRVCQATLMLNSSGKLPYRFTFTLRANGGYYIEGLPALH